MLELIFIACLASSSVSGSPGEAKLPCWSAAPSLPAAILSILNPLLALGLLLLGVNLGALLYMLLGLLGLAPHWGSSRAGIFQAWPSHNDEFLYRLNLAVGGKETVVYF